MTTSNKIPGNWPDSLKMADKIESLVRMALASNKEARIQCLVEIAYLVGSEEYDA